MSYYAIIVDIGDTTFVDGHYADEDLASDAFVRWKETYPNLHFDFCTVLGKGWIADELYMANNRKTLEIANERGKAAVAAVDENVMH